MRIAEEKLQPMKSPLMGFTGDRLFLIGSITMIVTLGVELKQTTKKVDFFVVN